MLSPEVLTAWDISTTATSSATKEEAKPRPPSMIIRPSQLRPIPSFLLPFTHSTTSASSQSRRVHSGTLSKSIPKPTPFVPNTQTFLTLIGRNLAQYAPKIPTWQDLFTLNSEGLKKLGIESPRARRYLQAWRDRYRSGRHGIGGDLKYVENGVALLRIVDIPVQHTDASSNLPPAVKKIVVNVAPGGSAENVPAEQLTPVHGFKIKSRTTITGPHVVQMRGRLAKIEVKEGLWEFRRGRKIDGGERRQAEVRAKRRGEEKRAATGGAR